MKLLWSSLLVAFLSGVSLASSVSLDDRASSNSRGGASLVRTYPIPDSIPPSSDFSIRVRPVKGGHGWKRLQGIHALVSKVNTTSGAFLTSNVTVANFDFEGPVQVAVTYEAGHVESSDIRPRSYGIKSSISGDTVTFQLDRPRNLMLQLNGDEFQALHLLTNEIEKDEPTEDADGLWYFGPGINNGTAADKIVNNTLSVPSNTTVYVAGGGALNALVSFQDVANASIRGHGMLYQGRGGGVLVERSADIRVADVTILNPTGYNVLAGECDRLAIHGIRGFSAQGNGDGIDLFCCRDSRIDGVFMRNSDDNVALYQHRWAYYGNSSNLTVANSALWADVAHPINVGTHGNTEDPETMSGLTIRNVDIMHHKETQMWYQGAIAINPGDANLIENIAVDDVRVEEIIDGQLINLRVMFNSKYNTSPGRGIRNMVVRKMKYDGPRANPSLVLGYDETRGISNITFEDLEVHGKLIYDDMAKPAWYYTADFVPMYAANFVDGLNFTRSS